MEQLVDLTGSDQITKAQAMRPGDLGLMPDGEVVVKGEDGLLHAVKEGAQGIVGRIKGAIEAPRNRRAGEADHYLRQAKEIHDSRLNHHQYESRWHRSYGSNGSAVDLAHRAADQHVVELDNASNRPKRGTHADVNWARHQLARAKLHHHVVQSAHEHESKPYREPRYGGHLTHMKTAGLALQHWHDVTHLTKLAEDRDDTGYSPLDPVQTLHRLAMGEKVSRNDASRAHRHLEFYHQFHHQPDITGKTRGTRSASSAPHVKAAIDMLHSMSNGDHHGSTVPHPATVKHVLRGLRLHAKDGRNEAVSRVKHSLGWDIGGRTQDDGKSHRSLPDWVHHNHRQRHGKPPSRTLHHYEIHHFAKREANNNAARETGRTSPDSQVPHPHHEGLDESRIRKGLARVNGRLVPPSYGLISMYSR